MWKELETRQFSDQEILSLARKVALLAEDDDTLEFADVRWMSEILEQENLRIHGISFKGLTQAVAVRMLIAEPILLARRAVNEGKSKSDCPYGVVEAHVDRAQGLRRSIWLQEYDLKVRGRDAGCEGSTYQLAPTRFSDSCLVQLERLESQFPGIRTSVLSAVSDENFSWSTRGCPDRKKAETVFVATRQGDPQLKLRLRLERQTVYVEEIITGNVAFDL